MGSSEEEAARAPKRGRGGLQGYITFTHLIVPHRTTLHPHRTNLSISAPAPATPKKTPGRKRAKKESDEGNDLDDEGEAVKKGKTPRKTAAKNVKKGPDDGAAEDEAVAGADTGASPPSIKKPRGRPRKNAAAAAFKPVKTDTFAEQAAAAANEHVDSVDPAEMVPAAQRQETSIPVAVNENTSMEGVVKTTE